MKSDKGNSTLLIEREEILKKRIFYKCIRNGNYNEAKFDCNNKFHGRIKKLKETSIFKNKIN